MSHFSVLVIGWNVEEQLQPYHEFECTGTDDEYVVEVDRTTDARETYERYTTKKLVAPDGTRHDPWEDRFYRDATPKELGLIGPIAGTGSGHGMSWISKDWGDGEYRTRIRFVPNGWEEVELPTREVETFEEFAADYYGVPIVWVGTQDIAGGVETKYGRVEVNADGTVRVIDRTNPNKKWDWWMIGGRWTGFFKVKPGRPRALGEPGLMTERPEPEYADQLRKRDVDVLGMRREAGKKANETYNRFERATAGLVVPPTWEEIRERHGKGNIDAAREEWREYPWVRALREAELDTIYADMHEEFFVGRGGREAYVRYAERNAFTTFGFVQDGKWHERGEMGWWGIVSDEKDDDAWLEEFNAMIDALPDDTLLTIVDCHI